MPPATDRENGPSLEPRDSADPLRPLLDSGSAGGAGGENGQSTGVYVHFPWCLQKCGYCDFLSVAAPADSLQHGKYADAVCAELTRRLQGLRGRPLDSIFFGGGTPSLWRARDLGRVLTAIRDALPPPVNSPVNSLSSGSAETEITVECNPSSFDRERAAALVDAGVNRVSIGVQSLDANRLRFLGRLHDGPQGIRAIEDALAAKVPRVSADFIFGVAGQTPEDAVREALTLAELGITHLSAYALTIEPGTQFGALARKGRLPLLGEDAVADTFIALHEALTSRGFAHYEISNYARDGHVARHNLGYWLGNDYLGLGCGAWGTVTMDDSRVRYRNTPVPERYLASEAAWPMADLSRTGSGELVSEHEVLSADTQLAERLMLGLRLARGLDVEAAAASVGADPWPASRLRAVERLTSRGRLRKSGSHLSIPHDAWLLADGTIAELL